MRKYIHVLILITIIGCSQKRKNPEPVPVLNPKPILENIFDNLIIPNFRDVAQKSDSLVINIEKLCANPNQTNLENAKINFENTFISYQHISPYMFGPSTDGITDIGVLINLFPIDKIEIERSITGGNLVINNANRKICGFGAMDYLLYHTNETNLIIELSDINRRNYLKAVANDIKIKISNANLNWKNYRNTFVEDTKLTAQSAINELFNANVKAYELIKNDKLGIPLGIVIKQASGTRPTDVEGYYSGITKQLLLENVKAVENTWLGKSKNGNDGTGFDDLLSEKNTTLKENTKKQFLVIYSEINKISENEKISDLITNQYPKITAIFTQISSNTRYLKSELASALGLTLTFDSNDGD